MKVQDIIDRIRSSDDQRVKFAIADIDGVLRGKIIHKQKLLDSLENGIGFCDVIFGWDSSDKLYEGLEVTGYHTGFPDAKAQIDPLTFRTIPWEEHIPFFLGDFSGINHPACPRNLLKKVIAQADQLGFETLFSQEFEWFNFDETHQTLHQKEGQNPNPLTPGMFGYSVLRASQHSAYFSDLFELLGSFQIPIEGIHTETGPGVYEACIQKSSILEAADRAVLFKTAVKEIASQHGITPTFMAKWNSELPGSGGHIHQSLWKDGQNLFHDPKRPNQLSSLMESYIAGQLLCLPEILPCYASTINSYKRLVPGTWAPTTLTWGLDNRTTALRVINESVDSTRLETRVPGADCNPYLAMAAALASGLYGIKKGLKLSTAPTVGNGYEDLTHGRLPGDLKEASLKMQNSAIAHELFDDSFIKHFTATRLWECQQYAAAVTNWEIKRYFEII